MIELRPATSDDLTTLLALARAFYDEGGFATTDDELARDFGVLLDSADAHVLLPRRDDESAADAP